MFEFEGDREGIAIKEVFDKSMERIGRINRHRAEKIVEMFPHLDKETVLSYLTLEDDPQFRVYAEEHVGDIWNFNVNLSVAFQDDIEANADIDEKINFMAPPDDLHDEFYTGYIPLLINMNPKYLPQKGAVEFRDHVSSQRALAIVLREKLFNGDSQKFIEALDTKLVPGFMQHVFTVFKAQKIDTPAEWRLRHQRAVTEHEVGKVKRRESISQEIGQVVAVNDDERDEPVRIGHGLPTTPATVFEHFKEKYRHNPTQFLDDFFGIKSDEKLAI